LRDDWIEEISRSGRKTGANAMKIPFDGHEICLPDFLMIGVMRGGTTSLYTYLSAHHEIFMPSLKEPQFFSYLGMPVSPHPPEIKKTPWTVKDYIELFKPARPDQIIGEASTSYIYMYPRTLENIKKVYGECCQELRIIGVLRNPIDRAWSIYSLKKQGGDWKNDFLSYVEYQYYNFLASGLYYQQVKAYLDTFPHTKFVLFDELKSDSKRVVRECLEFIGVGEVYVPRKVGTVYNYSGIPRSKAVEPLYRLLFSTYPSKTLLKNLIPERFRNEVKRWSGSRLSKKESIPPEIKKYLSERFEKDLLQLADLFKEGNQKKIIERWMT
jgi:hypothetical protein